MVKNAGGYALVDCTGVELTSESKQTVAGIYNKIKKAYASNKPVYACNLTFSDKRVTPVNIFINPLPGSDTTLVGTASTLQLRVDNADGVTIVNMAPTNRTAAKSKKEE